MLTQDLHARIGRLSMENDFLVWRARSHRQCERKAMIDKGDKLPVTRQCALLDLSRSGVYYIPASLSAKDRVLMHQIDEQYYQRATYLSPVFSN